MHVIIEVVVEASLGAVPYLLERSQVMFVLAPFSISSPHAGHQLTLGVHFLRWFLCPMPLLALPQYVRILHLTHPSCDLQFTNRFEHSAHLLVTFWHSGTPPRWPCLAPRELHTHEEHLVPVCMVCFLGGSTGLGSRALFAWCLNFPPQP